MTNEQQEKLFEAIQGAKDKYKEVVESFKQDNDVEGFDKLLEFLTSFQELSSVYEGIKEQGSTNEEINETEEVEKQDTKVWSNLFQVME